MTMNGARRNRLMMLGAAGAGLVALCACGDSAPPEPGEGAVGFVEQDNAGAAQAPQTPALSGGPEGQTAGMQPPVQSTPLATPPATPPAAP
jgi:hypothetical protein